MQGTVPLEAESSVFISLDSEEVTPIFYRLLAWTTNWMSATTWEIEETAWSWIRISKSIPFIGKAILSWAFWKWWNWWKISLRKGWNWGWGPICNAPDIKRQAWYLSYLEPLDLKFKDLDFNIFFIFF